ncbi:MAG TPA: sensor histidine kinase [Jatrophihabitantaceae bacterium]|nr:sensor histidine kinase [Jatrophihabitantaceae bacterium]
MRVVLIKFTARLRPWLAATGHGAHTVGVVSWIRRPRRLSAQLLAGQVVVLLIAGAVGFGLWARTVHGQLDRQYEQRALAIASATAAMPAVIDALTAKKPAPVQALATSIMHKTNASYVVVIDRTGVRYSHPNNDLIGQRVEEPVVALDGHKHVGIDHGSLGDSANGKAPVVAPDGRVVGEVSVGVEETAFADQVTGELTSFGVYLAVAIAVGLAVAVLLARRLKRQTFGLELDEIAALVQEREATLHGIREGVVALDAAGRVSLVNDQARLLLGTALQEAGRPVYDALAPGELRELMQPGAPDAVDRIVLHSGRFLLASRMRVTAGGRDLGAVVTLRDRTELENALRELDEVRRLTDALRAQQHEFSNRMHVMSGLLELGHYDEAIGFASGIDGATAGLAAELEARISSPRIVALLVAKTTVARERGIALTVVCNSRVQVDAEHADALVSIAGNLIDNAIDAAASAPARPGAVRAVEVQLAEGSHELVLEVSDTGPGIPAGTAESIFVGGWTTKERTGGPHRGIGLTVVRQAVDQLAGTIEVREGSGARFRVTLPRVNAEARP